MITFKHIGEFKKTINYLNRLKYKNLNPILEKYAILGLESLRNATPKDSGITADSWKYSIENTSTGFRIRWSNTSSDDGVTPIVILLHYGHATRSGEFVQGYDFINPVMKPIFKELLISLEKEVSNS